MILRHQTFRRAFLFVVTKQDTITAQTYCWEAQN